MKDLTGQWLDLMKTLLATSTTSDSWSTSKLDVYLYTSPSRLSKKFALSDFIVFEMANLSVSSDNAACTIEKVVNLLSNAVRSTTDNFQLFCFDSFV